MATVMVTVTAMVTVIVTEFMVMPITKETREPLFGVEPDVSSEKIYKSIF